MQVGQPDLTCRAMVELTGEWCEAGAVSWAGHVPLCRTHYAGARAALREDRGRAKSTAPSKKRFDDMYAACRAALADHASEEE